jgi:N-methylhydantoinase B
MRRLVRMLCDSASLSVLSERNVIPPYGVMGGTSGAPNRFSVVRQGKPIEPSDYPGKVAGFPLREGDIVVMETAGGGGYGDPTERDPETLLADIRAGYLTVDDVFERYGVAIDRNGRTDPQRTGKKREQIRAARLRLPLQLVDGPLLDGAKRLFELPHAVGKALDVTDGSMIEIVTAQGAALRGWAKFVDGREKVVRIDPTSLAILALKPNDLVEIRRPLSAHRHHAQRNDCP